METRGIAPSMRKRNCADAAGGQAAARGSDLSREGELCRAVNPLGRIHAHQGKAQHGEISLAVFAPRSVIFQTIDSAVGGYGAKRDG